MHFSNNQLLALQQFFDITHDDIQDFVVFAETYKTPKKGKPEAVQANKCLGITRKGDPCSRNSKIDGYCYAHVPNEQATEAPVVKTNCLATTKAGKPCSRPGKHDGYCYMHVGANVAIASTTSNAPVLPPVALSEEFVYDSEAETEIETKPVADPEQDLNVLATDLASVAIAAACREIAAQ